MVGCRGRERGERDVMGGVGGRSGGVEGRDGRSWRAERGGVEECKGAGRNVRGREGM